MSPMKGTQMSFGVAVSNPLTRDPVWGGQYPLSIMGD
jgi:hypothetical protein